MPWTTWTTGLSVIVPILLLLAPAHTMMYRVARRGTCGGTLTRLLSTISSSSPSSHPYALSPLTTKSILSQPVIASDANERVKMLKSLMLKKKRDALDLVLLEGHRQIIDAIASGLVPTQVLLTERALLHAPLSARLVEALQRCPSVGGTVAVAVAVHCVTDSVMDKLADTVHGQGAVASFPRPKRAHLPPPLAPGTLPSPGAPLLLLLDRPTDPGNVGTILRTAFGLGADAVVVVEGASQQP